MVIAVIIFSLFSLISKVCYNMNLPGFSFSRYALKLCSAFYSQSLATYQYVCAIFLSSAKLQQGNRSCRHAQTEFLSVPLFLFLAVCLVLFAARSAVQMGPFAVKVLQTVYAKCFIVAHSLHICAMILWPSKYLFTHSLLQAM